MPRCKKSESRIFTWAELRSLEGRMNGVMDDPCGIYRQRVKPKIIELLFWSDRREELERLIGR